MRKGDFFEVKVRGGDNRTIYKNRCSTSDQKKLNSILNTLKLKFSIGYRKIEGEESKWWDE